jgi:hypothetical protein
MQCVSFPSMQCVSFPSCISFDAVRVFSFRVFSFVSFPSDAVRVFSFFPSQSSQAFAPHAVMT